MISIPEDRILILDGAMGTMIQRYGLTEEDYRGSTFAGCSKELKGNNECLNLTRPDVIKAIHEEYIAAGADIIETNTFSANQISQSEYGCEDFAIQMAYEGARIAREAADEAEGDLTTCAQENLTAVRVVRAFGREQYEVEKFNRKNEYFGTTPLDTRIL